MERKKVIIVGGGFGGLNAARALKNAPFEILLLDKTNHHVFQPLLYQVATASLPASNIATSFREIFQSQANLNVLMADVEKIELETQKVVTADKETFSYDYLILAPGASHSYFGHAAWEELAPGLKTILDASRIRERILMAFENAERTHSKRYLNFAIIGGGPTGVEIAGSIGEFAHKTLKHNFHYINPDDALIYLIEGQDQLLPGFPKKLADKAKDYLEQLGVTVLLNTLVSEVSPNGLYIGEKLIEVPTMIWAAGNMASPLLRTLNLPLDRQGRVLVNDDLSLKGFPNVFVIGDAAALKDKKGNFLPAIAPVAIQEGKYVAKVILAKTNKPFVYFDKGMLATIGSGKAVGVLKNVAYSGLIAWYIWALIHISYLISFKNRLLVMIQCIYLYLIGSRPNRIIEHPIHNAKIS